LEYTPADQKSLYRRANAFERLGKLNEAISDAQRLLSIASGDEQTHGLLRKLRESAQGKVGTRSAHSAHASVSWRRFHNKRS
jgi:hypothetical protein